MSPGSSIYLIGLPGSGKSTVGRQLSRRIALPFFDSDHVIEQRLGCSIREFFEREGEAGFRQREAEVLASSYEIEVAGVRHRAVASLVPMHDPKSERVRA